MFSKERLAYDSGTHQYLNNFIGFITIANWYSHVIIKSVIIIIRRIFFLENYNFKYNSISYFVVSVLTVEKA